MSKSPTGLLQRLRQAYVGVRMPWRKHVLSGTDLNGNEFFEMPNPNGALSPSGLGYLVETRLLI